LKIRRSEVVVRQRSTIVGVAILVGVLEISRVIDLGVGRVRSAEDSRSAGRVDDRRTGIVVPTRAGAPEVIHEITLTGLSTRARSARAQPVVKDVVSKIVERADASDAERSRLGSDARQASLLMRVKIVMEAD